MHRALILGLVVSSLSIVQPRPAGATQVAFELRHTPILVRPNHTPSLCPILALSPVEHWWIGAGYELVQDYDAILWKSDKEGHKPIVLSGLRLGSWYRGGDDQHGASVLVGTIVTVANSSFSLPASPTGITHDTFVVDLGLDLAVGHVWKTTLLSVFMTPAWSVGRIASPAVNRTETYNAITFRIGGALTFVFGS
jgi:hypothetical protein